VWSSPEWLAQALAWLDERLASAGIPWHPASTTAAMLDVACRVAKIARVLTWDRGVRAARDEGQEVDEIWTRAPMETLASLLDDSYLGGA
jgi:hypothetical protein